MADERATRTMIEVSPETRVNLNRHLAIVNGERAKLKRSKLSLRQYTDAIINTALPLLPAVHTVYVEYTPET